MASGFLSFSFSKLVLDDLLTFVKRVDVTATADLLEDDAALGDIRDWVTKPAFSKGRKVRGPIASSLEEYLKAPLRSDGFTWRTVVDDNTAERDRALNGRMFKADDASSPIPPLHINCRCRREPKTQIGVFS